MTTPWSSSTRVRKPLARQRVEALARDLVLLRRERHAVGVALALDLGGCPSHRARRSRCGRDELVVVELRPAEPRPPLGSRLALVVLHEMAEEPPQRRPPPRRRAAGRGAQPVPHPARSPLPSAAAREAGRATAGRAAGSRAATRAARRSTGSPPRCSARRLRGATRRRSRATSSKETTASSPPFTSAERSNP